MPGFFFTTLPAFEAGALFSMRGKSIGPLGFFGDGNGDLDLARVTGGLPGGVDSLLDAEDLREPAGDFDERDDVFAMSAASSRICLVKGAA